MNSPSRAGGLQSKPPSAAATRPLTLLDCVAKDDKSSSSDGNSSSSSRARILEQQREVMLRRRQEAMRADVVRSVDDLSQQPLTTPAIPQFSAPRPEDADPTSAFGSSTKTTTLSSTLSSTASSTAPLNPTQVTEAKRPSSSIQPPPRGGASGKPRSSAAAAFRAKSYRRVGRSGGGGDGDEDGDGLALQSSLSGDEEMARDGAFLAASTGVGSPSPRRPPKPGRRPKEEKREDKNDLALALAVAAAADGVGRSFDLEALLSRPSGVGRFVTAPCPPEAGIVQCYIKRYKKGPGKLCPEYRLYTKKGDRFLMAAKRRPHNATSNYIITLSDKDFAKESREYLGKLRANFVGTEFQIFDHGLSAAELEGSGGGGTSMGSGNGAGGMREELGTVLYAANVLGSRGPRRMQVYLPRVSQRDNAAAPWREPDEMSKPDAMLERVRRGDTGAFHHFINKPPRWNDLVGAYVLNFNGRVTQASVKNFQLIDPADHEVVMLQFGRVGKNDFTMDLRWPFSPLQAFAVALSSFDSKIACD